MRVVTPILAALVLLLIAAGWDSGSASVSALAAAGPLVQGGSCPLTFAQEVKSAKAWSKLMPVLRHPRCSNCHGGIPDPLPGKGGKTINHMGVVDMDSTDTPATCEQCHEPGWRLAGHTWTDKKDEQICSSMKQQFSSAQFLAHIDHDEGQPPFIEMAYRGLRGLNDAGQTVYEADIKPKLLPDPPPGDHPTLNGLAQAWVDAQGGRFFDPDDCGCVAGKELDIHFRSTVTIADARVTSTITGEGSVILEVNPDPSFPEWDAASGLRGDSARITWSAVTISQPAGCDGQVVVQSSPPTQFTFWLGLSFDPELKLSLEILPGVDLHTVLNRCRIPNGTLMNSPLNDPIPLFGGAWMALHGQSAEAVALKTTAAMDVNKMLAMDPKALQAMTDAMKNSSSPAAAAAQMTALINQMMPGASQVAAAARDNYKLAIPGTAGCTTGTGAAFLARCDISQKITVRGLGQTITEQTTITIARRPARKP
jgi:hypothetical protein